MKVTLIIGAFGEALYVGNSLKRFSRTILAGELLLDLKGQTLLDYSVEYFDNFYEDFPATLEEFYKLEEVL